MSGREPKDLLRDAMEHLGLSQKDFARLVGVDPATVTRWLKGTQLPRGSLVAMIARTAGIDEVDLWRAINAAQVDENRQLKREAGASEKLIVGALAEMRLTVEENRRVNAEILEEIRNQTAMLREVLELLLGRTPKGRHTGR